MTPLTINDLTQTTLEGSGVFDVLMRANKAHLEAEFKKDRIKGPEYSTVYLQSLQTVMQTALQFLLQKDRNLLEAQLLEQQILVAQQEVLKAQAEVQLVNAQIAKLEREDALTAQQILNLQAEALNIPKQGLMLDAQVSKTLKDVEIADAEIAIKEQQILIAQEEVEIAQAKLANLPKEGALLDAQALLQTQQATNLTAEKLRIEAQTSQIAAETVNLPKQGLLIDAQKDVQNQQKLNLVSEELRIDAQTAQIQQQTSNAVIEADVLRAQKCKLDAEFDVLLQSKLKTAAEVTLLAQKNQTEKAQTVAMGVDADSVIGRQKDLYQAQTAGFARDGEQKAAKLMIDSWNVRRTTDEGTVADATNMLYDVAVGRAVNKLLTGVGA